MNKHLFLISGPAGSGKTTLVRMLLDEFSDQLERVITTTTRAARPNEKDGVDYHFVSIETFDKLKRDGAFLEWAQVFNERYGTQRKDVEQIFERGKHALLNIDTQGAASIRGVCDHVSIFIMPPSEEELKNRLQNRGTESKEQMEIRLKKAAEEMAEAKKYDFILQNDKLSIAYQELKRIIVDQMNRRS